MAAADCRHHAHDLRRCYGVDLAIVLKAVSFCVIESLIMKFPNGFYIGREFGLQGKDSCLKSGPVQGSAYHIISSLCEKSVISLAEC